MKSLEMVLAARMADRLLSLESCRNMTGQNTILAVVDGQAEQTRPLAERMLREGFSGSQEPPILEIMDRTTYETIQRLINAGYLKAENKLIQQLHCSPAFCDKRSAEKQRLHKEAQQVYSQADRKMRMSSVLAKGGFPLEALAPLSEAIELALKASAYLAGEDGAAREDELSLAFVESRIIPTRVLPDRAVAIVASLRESAKSAEELDVEAATNLLGSAQEIMDHVCQAINRSALG